MNKTFSIAKVTFKGYLRTKLLYAILGVVVIYLLILFLIVIQMKLEERNGAAIEAVFLNYSGNIFSFVLFFVSIISSAFVLKKEIKEKTILFILTKPHYDIELIAGKWLGVCLLIFSTVILFAIPFHIVGLIFFQKFYFYQDLFFVTTVISMAFLSSFVVMISIVTSPIIAIVIPIFFQPNLIGMMIKSLSEYTTLNAIYSILKISGLSFLYLIYYIIPSFDEVIFYPAETAWGGDVFKQYLFSLFYSVVVTLIYLFVAVYLHKRRKTKLVAVAG